MNETVLLCTAVAEVFLAIGYGLATWNEFLRSSRLAVLAMLGFSR